MEECKQQALKAQRKQSMKEKAEWLMYLARRWFCEPQRPRVHQRVLDVEV